MINHSDYKFYYAHVYNGDFIDLMYDGFVYCFFIDDENECKYQYSEAVPENYGVVSTFSEFTMPIAVTEGTQKDLDNLTQHLTALLLQFPDLAEDDPIFSRRKEIPSCKISNNLIKEIEQLKEEYCHQRKKNLS